MSEKETVFARAKYLNALIIVSEETTRARYRANTIMRMMQLLPKLRESISLQDSSIIELYTILKYFSNVQGYGLRVGITPSTLFALDIHTVVDQILQKMESRIEKELAHTMYGNVAQERSNLANYWWHLGDEYMNNDKTSEGLAKYKQAIDTAVYVVGYLGECAPTSYIPLGWAYENLSMVFLRLNDMNAAQRCFDRALEYLAKEREINDLMEMLKEGREQKPELSPSSSLTASEDYRYIQAALDRLDS